MNTLIIRAGTIGLRRNLYPVEQSCLIVRLQTLKARVEAP